MTSTWQLSQYLQDSTVKWGNFDRFFAFFMNNFFFFPPNTSKLQTYKSTRLFQKHNQKHCVSSLEILRPEYLSKSPHTDGVTLIPWLFLVNWAFWCHYNKIKLGCCCTCLVNIKAAILSFLLNKQKQNLNMQNADIKQPNWEKTLSHFPHFLLYKSMLWENKVL